MWGSLFSCSLHYWDSAIRFDGLSCTIRRRAAFFTTDPEGGRFVCHLMCKTDIRLQGRPRGEALIVLATILQETTTTYSTAMVSCAQCGVYISFKQLLPKEGGTQAEELLVARV